MSDGFNGAVVRAAKGGTAAALSHVRGVLFDLDGTLLDTEQLILRSFRYAVQKVLGKRIPDEQLMAKVGQPLNTQMWDFTSSQAVHDELCRVYRDYNAAIHDEYIGVFPGVSDVLRELRDRGLALGVVTSKRHEPALRGLGRFSLDKEFAVIVGSDDWLTHKPDPGPVVHGCDVLGLRPAECVYVGDSPFDLQAGRGAGCVTAAALWGMFPEDVLLAEEPDYVCKDIRDLAALFDG